MQTEVLNIEENKKELVLKALEKHKTQKAASSALGISQTEINRLTARFNIVKIFGKYELRPKKQFF